MLRNVFAKTLRDYSRSLLWWGGGLVAYVLMIVLLYPSIRDQPGLNDMMKAAPEALMRAFVGDATDLISAKGYLNSQLFFFLLPLLLLIFTIGFGSSAIAGEEERGTLELLLSNPLPRRRIVLDKFAALAATTGILSLTFWVGLVGGALAVNMGVGLGQMTAATVSAVLLALAFGALALAGGCATGKRGLSIAVASSIGVLAYFLNAFAPLVEGGETWRKLSPFYYYIGADPLTNGLNAGHAAVLLGLTVVLVAIGVLAFERRDLAV